jgi:hypothetical protein
MIRLVMSVLDSVVLRAVVSGLWLVLVSFQFLEGSDPLRDGDGTTTLTRIACGISASAGVAWLAVAVRIVATRGIGATTWRRSEHLFAVAAAIALIGAAALTLSPVYAVMGAALIVTSVIDLIDADRARELVAEHGLVEAAAEYERLAGSRRSATRKALDLLSVRDEVGTELADEVLCGIPMHEEPKP